SHDQRIRPRRPAPPQLRDRLAEPRVADHLRLDTEPQAAERLIEHAQCGTAEWRRRSAEIVGKSDAGRRLRRVELAERHVRRTGRAAEEIGQALLAVQPAQAVSQIDPVPALLDGIVTELAPQLLTENGAGLRATDLGERLDLHGKAEPGP